MRHPEGRPWTGGEMCERLMWAWAQAFGYGPLLARKPRDIVIFNSSGLYVHANTGALMSALEYLHMAERTLGRTQDLEMLYAWLRTRLKIGSSLEETCRERGWVAKTVRRRALRSCERIGDAFFQLSPALSEKHLTVSKSLLEKVAVTSATTPTTAAGDQEGE